MEKLLQIVKDNYWVFTIVSIILILALIGYFVENNIGKDVKIKKKTSVSIDEEPAEDIDTI